MVKKNLTQSGGKTMNDLQRVLIQSLIKRNHSKDKFCEDMKNTFTINILCEMLGIDRNRYNYLVKKDQLDTYLLGLAVAVAMNREFKILEVKK